MRRTVLRWIAVLGLGVGILAVVLYLASTVDSRPPEVLGVRLTQPLSSDERVGLTTTSIEVQFSEAVEPTAAERAFELDPAVRGAFSWSGSTMIYTPEDPLPLETEFAVTLRTGIPDEAGNAMSEVAEPFAFRTVGAPTVVAVDPADGATDVPLRAPIRITFSTLIDTTTAEAAVRLEPRTPLRLTWRQEILELRPLEPLESDRRYELVVETELTDQAGTPLAERSVTSFTTVASGLSVEGVVPADGTDGVAVRTPLAVELDGAIDPDSLDDVELTITPEVAGSLEAVAPEGAAGIADSTRRVLRFQPSGPLPPTTTFEVRIGPGVRSIDGRVLARDVAWSFTTGAPQPTLANQVVFLSDRAGVTNLWAMNADGSGERQVTSELSDVTAYAVAPDGRSLVVGDGVRLVAQRADGEERRELTEDGLVEFDPAFAPDGRSLLFGRADRATGSGLGIWRRAGTTGAAERLDVEDDEADPASPPPGAPPAPLVRAPRPAPDGRAIAWIDGDGGVVVLDLRTDARSRADVVAFSAPTWLPGARALVVSATEARPDGPPDPVAQEVPVLPLDPAVDVPRRVADVGGVGELRLVRVELESARTTVLPDTEGAGRAAVIPDGRLAFVRLEADAAGGDVWLTSATPAGPATVAGGGGVRVASVAPAPEPGRLVVDRLAADGSGAGIWVLDERSGDLARLSLDGRMPRPLP